MNIINKEYIIRLYHQDKTKALDIISSFIISNFNLLYINNLKQFIYNDLNNFNIKITDYLLYTPLPKCLLLDTNYFKFINSKYKSIKRNTNIIAANSYLPYFLNCPIPFTVPYISNNIKLITSNVYYYELTIDTLPFKNPWKSMNVSIGFGSSETELDNLILGWTNESIGYNSFDGSICCWGEKDKTHKIFGMGDTVGAGIIYEKRNVYSFFFTLNGKIHTRFNNIFIINKVIPMIGLNYNTLISVNFNTDVYCYDYRKHITPIVISII
jgi:hypothetical protein